jgi:hypothetical protein
MQAKPTHPSSSTGQRAAGPVKTYDVIGHTGTIGLDPIRFALSGSGGEEDKPWLTVPVGFGVTWCWT